MLTASRRFSNTALLKPSRQTPGLIRR
jgi:hypothetical protein